MGPFRRFGWLTPAFEDAQKSAARAHKVKLKRAWRDVRTAIREASGNGDKSVHLWLPTLADDDVRSKIIAELVKKGFRTDFSWKKAGPDGPMPQLVIYW